MADSISELRNLQVQSINSQIYSFAEFLPQDDQGILLVTLPCVNSVASQIQIRKMLDQAELLRKYNFNIICITTDSVENCQNLIDSTYPILIDFTRKISEKMHILGKEQLILRRIMLINHQLEIVTQFDEVSPYNFIDKVLEYLQLT